MALNSFQRSLLLIGVALALPLVVLFIFVIYSSFQADRRQVEQAALDRTMQITAFSNSAVEADLAAMQVLATAGAFRSQDWAEAYGRVQQVASINLHWRTVILSDLSTSEEIFNLRRPYEEARSPIAYAVRADALLDQPTAGRVTREGAGCPCVFLHKPVAMGSANRYVISVGVDPAEYQRILLAHLPAGAVAAIVDRDGRFIARSLDYGDRVGTFATEYVRKAVKAGGAGYYLGRTYEGFENYTAFDTSPFTGWSTHIAVASSLIDRPRTLAWATVIGGSLLALALAVALIAYALFDLAECRRTEVELAQAQKMEAVGRLTGGVAHDFNNLLTVIIGGLDMLQRRLTDAKQKRLVDNALEAARRGEKLTQQLLAFSRGQPLDIGPVDLVQVLANVDALVGRTLGSRISLKTKIAADARSVRSNANQLELAILNLAINASDAMPNGGMLKIESRRSERDASSVDITFKDAGAGMSSEVSARAMEPFFTTKPAGKGSGLGLSQVFGTVQQSGGTMHIDSKPGHGATVTLVLPRADEVGERLAAPAAINPAPPLGAVQRHVLVVDDEEHVRSFMAEVLRDSGYSVTEADGGKAALDALQRKVPDLLLADYSMPGMTGIELASHARAMKADLPVLIVSGYADAEALERALEDAALLRKPFAAGAPVGRRSGRHKRRLHIGNS